MEYYVVQFIIEDVTYYTIWYTSEKDGFILDENEEKILSFANKKLVKAFAEMHNYDIQDEITVIECDEKTLIEAKDIDCRRLLIFWNIVSDISNSLDISFLGNDKGKNISSVYNKLFNSCNFPAIVDGNYNPTPVWKHEENELIYSVVKEGMKILYKTIQ